MIKIFRHIRQSLIIENKTSKYFKYAIGEIILVVIGILIALQINNWNEEHTERNIEKAYMNNLLEDLKEDLIKYDKFQTSNKEIYTLIDSIIPNLKSENRRQKISQLTYWCRMITIKWHSAYPVERTFEQMKSSGHLRLIKDKEIANNISNYYNSLVEFEGYNEAGMLWAQDYVSALSKIYDAEIMMKILRSREMEKASESDLLTEDPIILNQLMVSLGYFNGALSLGESVSLEREKDAKELIEMIQLKYNLSHD